jgi:plastocyanin
MSSGTKLALGAMLLMGTVACGSSSMVAPTPTTVTATIMNGTITPSLVSVSVGSTVTWMNDDSSAHSLVADGGAFNSGTIAPNGQFSFTFATAGTFAYHDASNASVSGTVNVSPSTTSY